MPGVRREDLGPSIRFFAWLMRASANRGWTALSSPPTCRSACFITVSWSVES